MANKSYFPLDLNLDDKMRLIEAEFGITGFGVIVKLWQKIYNTDGYYIEWTRDVELLFAQDIRVGHNLVSEIVSAAKRRGLFDAGMFDKYSILTSTGIQKRHFNMMKRHKEVTVIMRYLLIDITQILKDVNIIYENVNIQGENTNEQKQIDKIDKIDYIDYIDKTEDSVATAPDPAIAVFHKYEQLIGIATPAVRDGIDFFIENGVEGSLIVRLIEYACEQGKRTWSYIKAAIRGNMDADIKTLDEYNRAQADRIENAKKVERANKGGKKSKFDNYNDTNTIDITPEKILAEMLGEGVEE